MELPADIGVAVIGALFLLACVIFGVIWRSIDDGSE